MQGFNGLTNKLFKNTQTKKIVLLEDVCESHGATFKNKTWILWSYFNFHFIMLIICLLLRV